MKVASDLWLGSGAPRHRDPCNICQENDISLTIGLTNNTPIPPGNNWQILVTKYCFRHSDNYCNISKFTLTLLNTTACYLRIALIKQKCSCSFFWKK